MSTKTVTVSTKQGYSVATVLIGCVAFTFAIAVVMAVVAIVVALAILGVACMLLVATVMAIIEWVRERRAEGQWHDMMDESAPTEEEHHG
jgi:uncharacterized membrane protein